MSWRNRAASFFINTAQDLGVVDAGNFLRYAAAKHSVGPVLSRSDVEAGENESDRAADVIYNDGANTVVMQAKSSPRPAAAANYGGNVWVYRDAAGGAVRLETPDTLSKTLWEKLTAYVKILEPDDQGKEG